MGLESAASPNRRPRSPASPANAPSPISSSIAPPFSPATRRPSKLLADALRERGIDSARARGLEPERSGSGGGRSARDPGAPPRHRSSPRRRSRPATTQTSCSTRPIARSCRPSRSAAREKPGRPRRAACPPPISPCRSRCRNSTAASPPVPSRSRPKSPPIRRLAFSRRVQAPDAAGIDAVADQAAAWVRLARTPRARATACARPLRLSGPRRPRRLRGRARHAGQRLRDPRSARGGRLRRRTGFHAPTS